MLYKTSKSMRSDPLFMRNQYPECGQWGIPLVKKQKLDISNIRLIACSDTRSNDNATNKQCGVHFLQTIIDLRIFIAILIGRCPSSHSMHSC